jgi:lysophospholipase L1-like esterase
MTFALSVGMRIVGILVASLLVLGPARMDAQPTAKIVLFGDSLTARGNWKKLLDRDDVVNRGLDGDTIRGATRRLHQVTRLRPEIVVVMLGINDLIHGRSAAHAAADLRRLRERLKAGLPTAHLVVISVLPVGPSLSRLTPQIEDLNERLIDLCSDGGCAYLDLAREFEPRGLGKDDLHLSEAGYARWAEVLRRDVIPAVETTASN